MGELRSFFLVTSGVFLCRDVFRRLTQVHGTWVMITPGRQKRLDEIDVLLRTNGVLLETVAKRWRVQSGIVYEELR